MKTFLIKSFMVALIIGCVCVDGIAQTKDSKKAAKEKNEKKFEESRIWDDTKFAVDAADLGMFEVQISELAKAKATTPEVIRFASMMIEDHSKANAQLRAAAAKKKITLPVQLSDAKQKQYGVLLGLTGIEFDRAYMAVMVSGHHDAIALFGEEADRGQDPDLKAWAASIVPTLKTHLSTAEKTEELVKAIEKAK